MGLVEFLNEICKIASATAAPADKKLLDQPEERNPAEACSRTGSRKNP